MLQSSIADRLDRLARLNPTSFPLLSLYLNTEVNEVGRSTFDVFLRKELHETVTSYPDRSTGQASLQSDVERIEAYVAEALEASTRALAVFASSGANLFEAIQLKVPVAGHQVVVSSRPYVYPLARLDDQHPRCAIVVSDTNTARIMVLSAGTTGEAIEVQSAKTRHTSSGGWSQSRLQRRVDNAHLQHAKAVVERLDQVVAAGQIEHVVVAGDEVILPLLREEFPARLAGKLVDVIRLDVRSSEQDVIAAVLDALRRKDGEVDEAMVKDLVGTHRAGGLAVVGKQPVLAALHNGQVDMLVITAMPAQIAGADHVANELVTLALQTDATVRFIENPELLGDVGGVAAALRYRI